VTVFPGCDSSNKKGAASQKRLLDSSDLLRPAHSVESASRTALALDASASLLQAVEIPAIDTAIEGADESEFDWLSSLRTLRLVEVLALLTKTIVAGRVRQNVAFALTHLKPPPSPLHCLN
jgi:hypothetical protein